MIDRELLAQVTASIVSQELIDHEVNAAFVNDAEIFAMTQYYAQMIAIGQMQPMSCLGALMAIGFRLGREYESLTGREYRSKLTEPFGGL